MDTIPKRGDEAGDVVGERQVGDVEGSKNPNNSYSKEYLECKISSDYFAHLGLR